MVYAAGDVNKDTDIDPILLTHHLGPGAHIRMRGVNYWRKRPKYCVERIFLERS